MKASGGGAGKAGEGEVPAPLAGTVAKILVAEGDAVKAGQVLLTLEAMKMETEINAPADGTVKGILVLSVTPSRVVRAWWLWADPRTKKHTGVSPWWWGAGAMSRGYESPL